MTKLVVSSVLVILTFCKIAYADSDTSDPTSGTDSGQATESVAESSRAASDPRLPPVVPGQEVKVGNKTMNLWSTSGPVVVNSAPAPGQPCQPGTAGCTVPAGQIPNNLNVIVDQRPETERGRGRR